ncbi:mucin-6 [Gracilaria domingensis]|nr:mucin-6 [Gracilaria domingensis]
MRFSLRPRQRKDNNIPSAPPDRHADPPKKKSFAPRLAALNSFSRLGAAAANHSFVSLKPKPSPTNPNPHVNNATVHPVKPPARQSLSPLSVLVNYDLHPSRNHTGQALEYASYAPSRFFVVPSSRTHRRRPRQSPTSSVFSSALALDYDTMARRGADFQPDFLPLDKRIQAKIVRLRQLLMEGDRIGDLQMLKDLAEILQANITRQQTQAESKRSQIKHAQIVAGFIEKRNHVIHIKKVSGKPSTFRSRTTSALKLRAASMRSTSRHPRSGHENKERIKPEMPERRCDDLGSKKGRSDFSRLTRKSSAHLRRLHSAGAVLIRKLSKSSVPVQHASCSPDSSASSTPVLDPETIKKLKTDPVPIINDFQMELQGIEQEELLDRAKLDEVEAQLEERRRIHEEAMDILDQFYGALPGWENDPISQKMILETVELTEAGVDAERDLTESRDVFLRAEAALADHQRAHRALQAIRSDLTSFVQILSDLIASADVIVETRGRANTPTRPRRYSVDVQTEAGEGVLDTLSHLERLLDRCIGQSRLAVECCCEAPRVQNLQDDLEQISAGFALEAEAVKKNGTIYHDDLEPTLQVSVTALGDCKLAEGFVSERQVMITEDLEPLRNQLERSEEYVMLERLAILDLRHPRDDR